MDALTDMKLHKYISEIFSFFSAGLFIPSVAATKKLLCIFSISGSPVLAIRIKNISVMKLDWIQSIFRV